MSVCKFVGNGMFFTHVKPMEPVNLVESVPPKAIAPLTSSEVVVGSKEMPMRWLVMVPWLKRLSVTVGIRVEVDLVRVL